MQRVEDEPTDSVGFDVLEVQVAAPEAVPSTDTKVQHVVVGGPVAVPPDIEVGMRAEALGDVGDPALALAGLSVR